MLNFIATGIVAFLLTPGRLAVETQGSNNIGTKPIPRVGPGARARRSSPARPNLVFGAHRAGGARRRRLLVPAQPHPVRLRPPRDRGVRDRGGGERRQRQADDRLRDAALRRRRRSRRACRSCSASSYSYSLDFPTGLGFTGIAIALLGRNSPIGIAFGALLWSFLDNTSNSLEFEGVPKQTVLIMQGDHRAVRRHRLRARAPLPHPHGRSGRRPPARGRTVARRSGGDGMSAVTTTGTSPGVARGPGRDGRPRGASRGCACSTSARCCSCCSRRCASSPGSAT